MRRTVSVVALFASAISAGVVACVGDDPVGVGNPVSNDADPSASSSTSSSSSGTFVPPPCGNAGSACCAGQCRGGAVCTNGQCACDQGRETCGDTCVNLQNDAANCGRCGRDCGGSKCTAGACAAITVRTGVVGFSNLVADSERYYWANSSPNGGMYSIRRDDFSDYKEHTKAERCAYLTKLDGSLHFRCVQRTDGSLRDVLFHCALPNCTNLQLEVLPGNQVTSLTMSPEGRRFFKHADREDAQLNGVFELLSDGSHTRVGDVDGRYVQELRAGEHHLYWFTGWDSEGVGVFRAPYENISAKQNLLLEPQNYYRFSESFVDDRNVYWIGFDGTQFSALQIPHEGGYLVTPVYRGAKSIVSDNVNLYMADDTSVFYCPRSSGCSGGRVVLSENEQQAYRLVLDGDYLLWSTGDNTIRRVAKP